MVNTPIEKNTFNLKTRPAIVGIPFHISAKTLRLMNLLLINHPTPDPVSVGIRMRQCLNAIADNLTPTHLTKF